MQKEDEKKPHSEVALEGISEQGISGLPHKLERYAKGVVRSSAMADYIKLNSSKEEKLASRLKHCGDWLVFRHYYTVDQLRLHSADFCMKHTLCPLCAIRRGGKMIENYNERVQFVVEQNPNLKAYMVTLTVKNGESLLERFNHLQQSLKKIIRQRQDYLKSPNKRKSNELCKANGAVYSIEFKRGKGSQEWHPHVHMVWLCESSPNQEQLSKEWHAMTGDSFIVDVRPLKNKKDTVSGFMEVFKYALKFSELSLPDNWEAYNLLKGKKLVAAFGSLRGVKIPDKLTDEDLNSPYIELFYSFCGQSGYHLTKTEHGDSTHENY